MSSTPPTESPTTVNISRIEVPDRSQLIGELENQPYSSESAYGFRLIENTDEHLVGELISNTYTQITRYDPESDDTIEESITSTDEITFRIDLSYDILEVYSNKEGSGELINRLGQTVSRIITHELNIDLGKIIESVENLNYSTDVTAIRINNVSPEPNTNGNCYLNTFTDQVAKKLLDKYESDVTYVCLDIELDAENDVTVGFYRSGSVRIFTNSSHDQELFRLIRQIVSEV